MDTNRTYAVAYAAGEAGAIFPLPLTCEAETNAAFAGYSAGAAVRRALGGTVDLRASDPRIM